MKISTKIMLALIIILAPGLSTAAYRIQFSSPVVLNSGKPAEPSLPDDYSQKNFQCSGKYGPSNITFDCVDGAFSTKAGPTTVTGICESNTYTSLAPIARATDTCL